MPDYPLCATLQKCHAKNLFPAGLRIESVAHSIEEIEEQSVFWGLETEQLGRGRYEGRISAVHSGSVQLTCSTQIVGTLFRATCPATR